MTILIPPWASQDKWHELESTIKYHTIKYHKQLNRMEDGAINIRLSLVTIFPYLDELCAITCSFCHKPCCLTAKVWYDFKDILFIYLIHSSLPPGQAIYDFKSNCRYLGAEGCSLPRMMRPWLCTWYLCPDQTTHLRSKPKSFQSQFNRLVQEIKIERKKLEEEFIRMIT